MTDKLVPGPVNDLKIHSVLVTALKPFDGNARIGDVDAIADSLRVNGQFRPLVVRKETREVLAGNHTLKAAKKLGWTHVNVSFVENITDDEATRIVLADNRTSDLAGYGVADLTALLEALPSLEGTGYDGYVLTNLEAAYEPSKTLPGTDALADAVKASTSLTEPQETPVAPETPTLREGTVSADTSPLPRTVTCPACAHQWEA